VFTGRKEDRKELMSTYCLYEILEVIESIKRKHRIAKINMYVIN
jgi:hypothetical protein